MTLPGAGRWARSPELCGAETEGSTRSGKKGMPLREINFVLWCLSVGLQLPQSAQFGWTSDSQILMCALHRGEGLRS